MMGMDCNALDANFSSWGPCIGSGIGSGSEVILVILLFGIFAYILYRLNIPTEAAMALGVGMLFVMGLMFSSEILNSLIVLIPIVLAGYLIMAFLKHAGRS